jgi:3-hydroxyisobutyrate dehydrogenase-like beta-hydroxyacid dehydrogenase
MFPLALAAKDLRYAVAAAAAAGAALPIVAATGEVLAAGEARGLGAENVTAVARLYAPEPPLTA